MKHQHFFYISLLMMIVSSSAVAQIPSIQIKGEKNATVSLKTVDIDVEIFGNVSITTMKMVFHNNTSRILEGELTFPMPEGVTVSRYAIDINGKLRDAVPVPKAKATEVFESIEHRQIDPGLLERVEGNNFRTRIYPLPANGDRTVLIAYEEALTFNNENTMQYHLPLDFQQRISAFSLQTNVYQSAQKPRLSEQPDGSFVFSEKNQVYQASLQKTDYMPQRSLTIQLPKNTNIPEVVLQPNRDGSSYFLINAYQKADSRKKTWSNRMGIIWDNSLSGLQRDTEKELALLDLIIKQKQNLTIELGLLNITFKKAKSFTIKNGEWSELKTYLQNIVYDGGTDFSTLNEKALQADEYLFFSEGLSTFGKNTVAIHKPVYSITSSTKADFSTLKTISDKSGGKFVNLQNTSVNEAFRTMNENNLQFLGIQEKSLVSEVYPSIPTEINGHISVAGIVQRGSGEITLLFGRNGKVESTQKVQLSSPPNDIKVSRIWAQKKIAEMDIQYEQHKDDIELLGKQFGIVTRNTSLIVLEDLADYIRYEITPPAELLSAYNEQMKNQQIIKENRVNDLLDRAIRMVSDLKKWWNTDFKPEKTYPVPVNEEMALADEESVLYHQSSPPSPATEEEIAPEILNIVEDNIAVESMDIMSFEDNVSYASLEAEEAQSESRDMERRSTNRTITKKSEPAQTRQTGKIKLPGIQSDNAYMQQIRSANDFYASYLTLRETYMGTPGFYFDISNFFYEKNQPEKGLLILSNLADLDLENAELFKTLAYRLKEKGAYQQELYITQKVREWRPMDPQSHRDYALALQDNGQYQEALDCLYSILNASYSPEAALRDHGIEEILVCEINNLISLHRKKLDLSKIDSKLITDMPVDIRVVINWNKNDTDIDLWVTDPRGEKCYYRHKQTAIGGRLSDDFTQGFGPEQFLLKKAINGTYKIETNFFGERQLTLSGPTTIMGEIYLSYSDGREERQVITFQNGENGKETKGVLIGEFEFSDKQISENRKTNLNKNDEPIDENKAVEISSSSPQSKHPFCWDIGICCLAGLLLVYTKKQTK